MSRSETAAWPRMAGIAIAALAVLLATAPAAPAATGGAPTAAGGGPAPASPRGTPAPEPSAGILSLAYARTAPRKSFFFGVRYPRLSYAIESSQPVNDLRIDILDRDGKPVRTFFRNGVEPNVEDSVRWDGMTSQRRPARNGRYRFRILPQNGDPEARRSLMRSIREAGKRRASSSSSGFGLGFALYGFTFPVLGPYDFGSAGARFGAGRGGRTHQGHDVMAKCGTPLVAARGGRVVFSGWHGAAGNYVVIDGRGTGWNFAYMHLLQPSPLKVGTTVRTGQPIGLVGSTGSSTACHLHFEIWTAPGWYKGGSPIDPLPFLQRWSRYS